MGPGDIVRLWLGECGAGTFETSSNRIGLVEVVRHIPILKRPERAKGRGWRISHYRRVSSAHSTEWWSVKPRQIERDRWQPRGTYFYQKGLKGTRVRCGGCRVIDGFRVDKCGVRICKTPSNRTGRGGIVRSVLTFERPERAKGGA